MFIGKCNRIAYQFIQSYDFRKEPVITIIFGREGLGKTSLLNYLHNRMINQVQSTLLLDARKFSSKYAFAAQTGNLNTFRRNIRSTELLLIDNINTLMGKARTIDELFHTLETIFAQGGKAIITYEGATPCYKFLGERFASRLNAALAIPIHEPDLEERISFLNYYLGTESGGEETLVESIIAESQNFKQIIDRAERAFNYTLTKETSSLKEYALTEESIIKYIEGSNIEQLLKIILPCVCNHYGIDEADVMSRAKRRPVVEARYMVYLLLHELFYFPYNEIAKYFQKNASTLTKNSRQLKRSEQGSFENLCQKLYNQLETCKNSKKK